MGLLKHPHPRILPVICNEGWRLVNLGIYVYFDVRWGRRHPHHFSKEREGLKIELQGDIHIPLALSVQYYAC